MDNHDSKSTNSIHMPAIQDISAPFSSSHKRCASSVLEPEWNKEPKLARDISSQSKNNHQFTNMRTRPDGDDLTYLEMELERARCKILDQQQTIEIQEGEINGLHSRVDEFETSYEARTESYQEAQASKNYKSNSVNKQFRESTETKFREQSMLKQKKYKELLCAKEKEVKDFAIILKKKYQEKIDELKRDHNSRLDQLKEEGRKRNHELSDFKAQQKENQKILRSESQERAKAANHALKEQQKENSKLAKDVTKLQESKAALESQIDKDKRAKEFVDGVFMQARTQCETFKNIIQARDARIQELILKHTTLEADHAEKAKCDDERWAKQIEKAHVLEQGMVEQRRANFVLRNGLECRDKQIEKLQAKLRTVEEKRDTKAKATA